MFYLPIKVDFSNKQRVKNLTTIKYHSHDAIYKIMFWIAIYFDEIKL